MRLKQPTYFVRRQLSDSRPVLVYQMWCWPMELRRYGQSQMAMLLQHHTTLPVGLTITQFPRILDGRQVLALTDFTGVKRER